MVVVSLLAISLSVLCFVISEVALISLALLILLFVIAVCSKANYRIPAIVFAIIMFLIALLFTNNRAKKMDALDNTSVVAELVAVSDMQYNDKYNSICVMAVNSEGIPQYSKFELNCTKYVNISCGQKFVSQVHFTSFKKLQIKKTYYADNICLNAYSEGLIKFNGRNGFFSLLGKIRAFVFDKIEDNTSPKSAVFLKALTCGDKSALSYKMLSEIRACGVSHIIVVSGLHLSIIMTALYSVLDTFIYRRGIKAILSIIFVFAIVCICGFTVSIIRATIMFITVSLAPLFKKENDPLNSLGFAVFLILLQSPYAIFSLSFQYSALATLAIVWVAPFYKKLINNIIKEDKKIIRSVYNIIVTTITATAFTLPVTIRHFGEISLIAPVVNIVLNFPITYTLIFTILGIIFGNGFLAAISFAAADWLAEFNLTVIEIFGRSSFATKRMGYTEFILSICLVALLPLLMYLLNYRKVKLERKGSEKDDDI